MKSSPCSLQLEKAWEQQPRPNTARKKLFLKEEGCLGVLEYERLWKTGQWSKGWEFAGGSGRKEQCDEGRSAVSLMCLAVGSCGSSPREKEKPRDLVLESVVFGRKQRWGSAWEFSDDGLGAGRTVVPVTETDAKEACWGPGQRMRNYTFWVWRNTPQHRRAFRLHHSCGFSFRTHQQHTTSANSYTVQKNSHLIFISFSN